MSDVFDDQWFYNPVVSAFSAGLLDLELTNNSGSFHPDEAAPRGEVIDAFYRLAGMPDCEIGADLQSAVESKFRSCIAWGTSKGIVTGYDDGTYRTGENITREQLAALLYRYASALGGEKFDLTARADLSGYADADSIGKWARDAVSWACAKGLMEGTGSDQMTPLGTTTKAQLATILVRFMDEFNL